MAPLPQSDYAAYRAAVQKRLPKEKADLEWKWDPKDHLTEDRVPGDDPWPRKDYHVGRQLAETEAFNLGLVTKLEEAEAAGDAAAAMEHLRGLRRWLGSGYCPERTTHWDYEDAYEGVLRWERRSIVGSKDPEGGGGSSLPYGKVSGIVSKIDEAYVAELSGDRARADAIFAEIKSSAVPVAFLNADSGEVRDTGERLIRLACMVLLALSAIPLLLILILALIGPSDR